MSVSKKFLGIEIGGTKLQLCVADVSGNIEQTIRYEVNPSDGAAGIKRQITEAIKRIDHLGSVAAIGVGFGGPVNRETGTINISHQISGWKDFNLAGWLQQLTQKPVAIENDANVAALAEAVYGCGKEYARVFYMTIGSGIGGGMITDREIYHGRTPGETEIGHLRLNKKGVTLESVCSGWAVNKKVRTYLKENPGCLLAKMAINSKGPESALLKPALEQNDEAAKKMIEEIADDIAFALSHVIHLFHPDIIVIGGGLSLLDDHLRKPVAARLPGYVMKAFLPSPNVATAVLGENVVPLGATELAKKYWLEKNRLNSTKHFTIY